MLDDGINYLMSRRSQIGMMLGQRKEMGVYGGFGESRPMVSEDEMWIMVTGQKK